MAQLLFICFILAEALVGLAMASENVPTLLQSNRKLMGKHSHDVKISEPLVIPVEAPSMPPNTSSSGENASVTDDEGEMAIAPGQQQQDRHNHHPSVDKSMAGGGMILGGLATTFLVVVFCYIRATGRDQSDTSSSNA